MGESWSAIDPEQFLSQLGWVRQLVRRLVSHEADADDLVQETFLAASRASHKPKDLRSWLSGTVRNLYLHRVRSNRRRQQREAEVSRNESMPSSAEVAEAAEACELLVHTVRCLDEPFGTTILLHFYSGLSARQIAERENITPEAARARIRKGLELIRSKLDRHYGSRHSWCAALLPLILSPAQAVPVATAGATATVKVISLLIALLAAPAILIGMFVLQPEDPPVPVNRKQAVIPTIPSSDPAPGTAPRPRDAKAPPEHPVAQSRPRPTETTRPQPPCALSGRVVDSWNNPLVGLFVQAQNEQTKECSWTRTAEHGRYAFSKLPPGTYTVTIRASQGMPVETWSPFYFEPKIALPKLKGLQLPAADVVIRFEFPAALTGYVVDEYTGRPFDHGVFPIIDGAFPFPGLKPVRGRFTIVFARARTVRLALSPVSDNGYFRSIVREFQLEQDFLQRGVRIELPPGGSITGTVRHAAGKVLSGVEISVRPVEKDEEIAPTPRSDTVDATGLYRISGIPEGPVYLDVVAPGYPCLRFRMEVVMGTETRRDILVRDGGWLDLEAIYPSGDPAEVETWSVKCLSSADPQHPFPGESSDPDAITFRPKAIKRIPLLPGDFQVKVTSHGREYTRRFTIRKSKRTPVTIRVDTQEEKP